MTPFRNFQNTERLAYYVGIRAKVRVDGAVDTVYLQYQLIRLRTVVCNHILYSIVPVPTRKPPKM